MKDGPIRAGAKWVARMFWSLDLWLWRVRAKRRGEPRYELTGVCNGCGMCCEEPSVAVSRLIWSMTLVRASFLWWQRVVNRFELARAERDGRVFVFTCGHFDKETRQCDSYATRPGMCRDYPRGLLFQPFPELFKECSHGLVSKDARRMKSALDGMNLSDEQRAKLEERLGLNDE